MGRPGWMWVDVGDVCRCGQMWAVIQFGRNYSVPVEATFKRGEHASVLKSCLFYLFLLFHCWKENRRDCRRCSEKVRSDITAAVKGLLEGHAWHLAYGPSNHAVDPGWLGELGV